MHPRRRSCAKVWVTWAPCTLCLQPCTSDSLISATYWRAIGPATLGSSKNVGAVGDCSSPATSTSSSEASESESEPASSVAGALMKKCCCCCWEFGMRSSRISCKPGSSSNIVSSSSSSSLLSSQVVSTVAAAPALFISLSSSPSIRLLLAESFMFAGINALAIGATPLPGSDTS